MMTSFLEYREEINRVILRDDTGAELLAVAVSLCSYINMLRGMTLPNIIHAARAGSTRNVIDLAKSALEKLEDM